ncbi:MAG: ABC transporter permease [Haloarculaceae archaeon]
MPSTDVDESRFTRIDWDAEAGGLARPRWRTIGLLTALAVVAVLFAYDFLVGPRQLVGALNWDLNRIDWLLLISVVLLGRYVGVPLASDRRHTRRYGRELLSRPPALASVLVLSGFVVVTLVGPELLDRTWPRLRHASQPPLFRSYYVADQWDFNCVGEMVNGYCHGSLQYPLGTTNVGEDIALLLARGVRIAVVLGISAAMIMGIVATAVGTTAGYVGGWVDDVLMSYVDVQQTVPAIVVYIVVATMFLGNVAGVTQGGLFAVALVFGLFDWGGIARIVRSEVMARRSAGYVRAARSAGASDLHVIRRHIIPNSTGTIVTSLTRRIPLLVIAQTILAFLELHRAGSKSFGRILRLTFGVNWKSAFVVILLVALTISLSIFGDEVRDVIDPRAEVA